MSDKAEHTPLLPLEVVERHGFIFVYDVDERCIASLECGTTTQEDYADYIVKACNAYPELVEALNGMLSMYVELVESGDAGFWDAEGVDEVVKARAALESVEVKS